MFLYFMILIIVVWICCAVKQATCWGRMHPHQYRSCGACIRWCRGTSGGHSAAESNGRRKDWAWDNDFEISIVWTRHQVDMTAYVSILNTMVYLASLV